MLKIDAKELCKDHQLQFDKAMRYNGWGSSKKDKKKKEIYCKIWRDWDNEKIKELSLKEYLGEPSFADLIFILDNSENFGLIKNILTEETVDNVRLLSKEETISIINDEKKQILFKKDSYYICLRFKTKIKEHFYAGNFIKHKEGMSLDDGLDMLDELNEDPSTFMPTLVTKIEEFIGEYSIYDNWEYGSTDFGLYWDIRNEKFDSFINKFLSWIKYEELEDLFIYYWVLDRKDDTHCHYDINRNEIV